MAVDGIGVEVEEIPALPDALEVNIPVADTGEAPPGDLLAIGGTEEVPDFDLESRLDLLPEVVPGEQSSLLNPGAMWSVRGLTRQAETDMMEVSVGRYGAEETSFLVTPDQASGLETGSLLAAPSEDIYEAKSLFGLVKTKVEFRPDRSSPPVEIDTWLPILRLHCPHHPGCEARYEVARKEEREGSFELSMLGVGGGGGVVMTCTVSQKYEARAGCIEIVVPAKLLLQTGSTYVNGTEVAYGLRATIKDVDTAALKERDLPAGHGCGLPFDEIDEKLFQLDRRENTNEAKQVWRKEVELETRGKLTVGLELPKIPLKLSIEYVRRSVLKTAIEVALSSGARYAAYIPSGEGEFDILWTP